MTDLARRRRACGCPLIEEAARTKISMFQNSGTFVHRCSFMDLQFESWRRLWDVGFFCGCWAYRFRSSSCFGYSSASLGDERSPVSASAEAGIFATCKSAKYIIMTETFNPAPFDKYAETPKDAARGNRETQEKLKAGLVGTFPASDPVSVAQPLTTKHDAVSQSLWGKFTSLFKH